MSNRLYHLRTARGMSQEELGGILGVTGATISRYERGEMVPSRKQMRKLLDEFGDDLTAGDFYPAERAQGDAA